ncbi:hypothetical protein GOODEAATRI_000970 [Goodea atripinnis]|uniref:Uncharacterized protein n=1 Tax=Goodea atripinnis TaxID=208336 RepID=A0ABV0MR97_9TELE
MDVYQEALSYLESQHVAAGGDILEDVFQEEAVSCFLSPFSSESIDFPDTLLNVTSQDILLTDFMDHSQTSCTREEMLEKKLAVLRGILDSEEVYLRELDALLTLFRFFFSQHLSLQPMKALRASAGTSQPVLSSQQVQTVFYQVPELRDVHQSFFSGLKARLSAHSQAEEMSSAQEMVMCSDYKLEVGDLFLKMDLLKTTPVEHKDHAALQEALRLSQSFLSGVNESSQSKREVKLTHGMRRQLMRDGFVVNESEGVRSLRHLFLYTDLLLCTRFKHAGRGKQDQYRFSWYLPLAGLRLRWVTDHERPPDTTELSFQVDGAQKMMVLCVSQSDGQDDTVLGKTTVQDLNSRLVSMLSLLQSCPDVNRNTFLYLVHHLQRVAQRHDVNKMTLLNLATVFGPSLLRPPVAGLEQNGATVDISQEVVIQGQGDLAIHTARQTPSIDTLQHHEIPTIPRSAHPKTAPTVQVVFSYLQSNNLPEAQTSAPYSSDTEDETTHM